MSESGADPENMKKRWASRKKGKQSYHLSIFCTSIDIPTKKIHYLPAVIYLPVVLNQLKVSLEKAVAGNIILHTQRSHYSAHLQLVLTIENINMIGT